MRLAAIAGVSFIAAAAVFAASCQGPTEITIAMSTDVPCGALRGTTVTTGHLGEVEAKPTTTGSPICNPSGDLGDLVIVPSGTTSELVAIKIVAGVGRDADSCVPPYGKGCIVARRAIRYVPHANLRISVPLRAACDGIACGETETCVGGVCVNAEIVDPAVCAAPDGCGESVLLAGVDAGPNADGGGGPDAAIADVVTVDQQGPVGPVTYGDVTNVATWSSFDLSPVSASLRNFGGAVFDGRYLYLLPNGTGVVGRYDTQAAFTTATSWSSFSINAINANANAYRGAVFDGRYVYFAPKTGASGLAVRYDTQAPFASTPSWTILNLSTVGISGVPYEGATFDGRYVYFVPAVNDNVVRYDTQGSFATAGSWSQFDTTTVNTDSTTFIGGTFDGRYVYFAPNDPFSVVTRYDTQAATGFAAGASWSAFATISVNPLAKGFFGAGFDGRRVYFVPYQNTVSTADGIVTSYDTQAAAGFGNAASWATFDVQTLDPSAIGYNTMAFDGRYAYFVPGYNGKLARYDSTGSLTAATSWKVFDTKTINASLSGFNGAGFDGRYIYLVPAGSLVSRFEARAPAGGVPRGGSFL